MDPESRKLLEENLELARENNNMLHSMKRSMQIARIMSFVYWIFIIGSAVGVYYLIAPYIAGLTSFYSGAGDIFKNFQQ